MSESSKIYVIGLMSGTSVDGLDVALCEFDLNDDSHYKIVESVTIPYEEKMNHNLKNCRNLNGYDLTVLDHQLGILYGNHILNHLSHWGLTSKDIFCIGSHGHTVFHQPVEKFTLQIGNGAQIAALTGIKTVSDFRSLDVALGGQGAPLVPIGDQLLFREFDACINLGGIANISFKQYDEILAFDICPFNLVFNTLINKIEKPFDKDGKTTGKGKLINLLYEELNKLEYYTKLPPKSLGIEWVEEVFLKKVSKYKENPLEDIMYTCCSHFVHQVTNTLSQYNLKKVLITGGGSYHNVFINQLILSNPKKSIEIPDERLIEFKEALIFALLAKLKLENKINVLKSVTGSSQDSSSGVVYDINMNN